jgi:hypothetical protein
VIPVDFYKLQYIPKLLAGYRLTPPAIMLTIYFRYSEEAVETLKNHGYNKKLNPGFGGAVSLPINFKTYDDEWENNEEYFQELIRNIKSIFTDELQAVLFSKSDDSRLSKLAELILTCFDTQNAQSIEL